MQRRNLLAAAVAALLPTTAAHVVHARMPGGAVRLWGDGVHDDTAALQELLGGRAVTFNGGVLRAVDGRISLPPCTLLLSLPSS